MYCELLFRHRTILTDQQLEAALDAARLGKPLSVVEAHSRSNRKFKEKEKPEDWLRAHETDRFCFVVCRGIQARHSVYHIEGWPTPRAASDLLEASEFYAHEMRRAMRKRIPPLSVPRRILQMGMSRAPTKGTIAAIRLFDDFDNDTKVIGKELDLVDIVRHEFYSKELGTRVSDFLVVCLLVFTLGARDSGDLLSHAGLALLGGVAFVFGSTLLKLVTRRGRIQFKLQE